MAFVAKTIGKTSLVKLEYFSKLWGAEIYAKYEASNPGASIKDRPAQYMIEGAEARGEICPGKTVLVEPTSGNTGIALAMIGAAKGYKVVLCMPESMSKERRALLRVFGARLELTPAALGMGGAVARAHELAGELEDAWLVGQFVNPDNPRAHYETTAPEIHDALMATPDVLVAGVGTGGTITGSARYFRPLNPELAVFAVEPAESPIIGQALAGEELQPGKHGIQGIGANFIPEILDLSLLDGAIRVATPDAVAMAKEIAQHEGFLVGISSGANLCAVKQLLKDYPEYQGKTIVTFLVDTAERYLSTPLFEGLVE